MNITLLSTTALTLLADIAPFIDDSTEIGKIIGFLETAIPWVAQEASDLLQPIQAIIAALKNNGAVTPDQITSLQALDAQVDAAFDAALSAYNAAHPAPATGG